MKNILLLACMLIGASLSVNAQNFDIPPNPESGKCYERCFDYDKKFYHINSTNLKNTILEKLYKNPNTLIISDHKIHLNKFNKTGLNTTYLSPNAVHLANSFFKGYGVDDLKIIYHHTYYK